MNYEYERQCDTTPFTDIDGDGCEGYHIYPEDCGSYDTDDFHANEDCCGCIEAHGGNSIQLDTVLTECATGFALSDKTIVWDGNVPEHTFYRSCEETGT